MEETLIKTDKQSIFNQVKGVIEEINLGDEFCNITLKVGHENMRMINFTIKRIQFDDVLKNYNIGEKVSVRFYISSRKKHDRWYTTATILDVRKEQ